MAGWDDSIFDNLPGSPPRPQPPPARGLRKDLFPVNPGEVIGGLQHQYAEGIGNAAAYMAGHPAPLPSTSYWVQPESVLQSANQFGRDITAKIEQPGEGIKPSSAAHAIEATHVLPVAPVVATGWAPSAWKRLSQLKQENPDKGDFIDGLANLTPDQARVMPPFGSSTNNKLLDDVLNAHNDDLNLVDRVRGGSPYASIPLREMRGQQFDDPGTVASLQPSGPQSPAVQQASTPWDTFRLKQPNMPPFPANDPRGAGPPQPWPPGTTLNSQWPP